MKELKATLYDVKGYLVPGVILLWGIIELISLTGYKLDTAVQKFPPVFMGVATVSLSYVAGHALHTLANGTIDKLKWSLYPPKFYFDAAFNLDFSLEQRKTLQARIRSTFQENLGDYAGANGHIMASYWSCFQYVMAKQVDEVENFLSLTGFYRGTTTAFGVTAVVYAAAFVFKPTLTIAAVGFVSAFLCIVFFARVSRFNRYLARSVYTNFVHLVEAPPPL